MAEINMEQEDDDGLLLYMSYKKEYPEEAKLALAEFYNRYRDFVTNTCNDILKNLVNSQDADDLFSEVFNRIFERAETFNSEKLVDGDDMRKSIELWIMRIAHNMAIDWRRKDKKQKEKYEEYQPILNELKKLNKSSWTPLDKEAELLFEEEFNKLSKRDREIIIQSGLYYNLNRGESDMPPEIIEQIADEFGTTPENIRQVRSRFIRRVRDKTKQD